ncbi:MAG TPA: hypothetical protein DDX54_00780 [Rhodospirillaceae bacterium]|jgi:hypothetical protein|nr:flagellar export chaperone FlgN [Alphaproteobacteria bacterium]HBH25929.1 hypothetical protein [Rhodospirillaceae bacterium]
MKTTPLLPDDPAQALQVLIRLTTAVLDLTQQEAGALARRDGLTFTALQEEKEASIKRYTQASGEFRARVQDFQGADKATLDRLYALQEDLSAAAQANNAALKHAGVDTEEGQK